ncbi:MAG: metal-dependent hydrolase [Candidatus Heimdallarchaeota archaeon]
MILVYKISHRTAHVTIGVILGAAYIPVEFLVINSKLGIPLKHSWLYWVAALLLAIIGAEAPDFDHLYSFMSHRDIVSHSAIYPGIVFGLCIWWKLTVNNLLIGCFIPFLIAYSSHLVLDYFQNIDMKKLSDGELRIKEKKGYFLMHVPFIYKDREGKTRRTLSVKNTERWLLGNAFLCLAMAAVLAAASYFPDVPDLF